MKKIAALFISLSLFAFAVLPVSAQLLVNQEQATTITNTVGARANFAGTPIEIIIASVIKIILGFLAIIFLVLITIAGFKWMTAQGNSDSVSEAQSTIRGAIIGLIIVLAAYGITYFVFKYIPFSGGVGTMTDPF